MAASTSEVSGTRSRGRRAPVGLALIEPLLAGPRQRRNHRLPAVQAHLLERSGRLAEAHEAYLVAAALATGTPEQRYLQHAGTRTTPPLRKGGRHCE